MTKSVNRKTKMLNKIINCMNAFKLNNLQGPLKNLILKLYLFHNKKDRLAMDNQPIANLWDLHCILWQDKINRDFTLKVAYTLEIRVLFCHLYIYLELVICYQAMSVDHFFIQGHTLLVCNLTRNIFLYEFGDMLLCTTASFIITWSLGLICNYYQLWNLTSLQRTLQCKSKVIHNQFYYFPHSDALATSIFQCGVLLNTFVYHLCVLWIVSIILRWAVLHFKIDFFTLLSSYYPIK